MKKVEWNKVTGHPNNVLGSLNRKVAQYLRNNKVKVGITGREPQERFNEHLQENPRWQRMIVVYVSSSEKSVNFIENQLVNTFKDRLINEKNGGGSKLRSDGDNYAYLLLR